MSWLFVSGDFPDGSNGKTSAYNVGDLGSILGLGRSSGEGNGNPLQYSCLENPWTKEPGRQQSIGSLRVGPDFSLSLFTFHALEKEMVTHSNVLAWRIPGTGKPGGLPSVGLHRVGHD